MDNVITIKSLSDNLIYLYRYSKNNALVIDPSDANAVIKIAERDNLTVTHILATHHHWDHTAGIVELKQSCSCRVISSDKRKIPATDSFVQDGDVIKLGDIQVNVIATPGHTKTSVCYYVHSSGNDNKILFSGDTLFIGGCGRLLECDAETMWQSLQKLIVLSDDTSVYPGHNYTVENYEFALKIEPDNKLIKERLKEIHSLQKQTGQSVPSTILKEKQTNVFLRVDSMELKAVLGMPNSKAVEIFAELRRRKDSF